MSELSKPRYRNHCRECIWLGKHGHCDLYFCPQRAIQTPSLVARWGNDRSELTFFSLVALESALKRGAAPAQSGPLPVLETALRLAREAGLLSDAEPRPIAAHSTVISLQDADAVSQCLT
jgi:hypothetical protein